MKKTNDHASAEQVRFGFSPRWSFAPDRLSLGLSRNCVPARDGRSTFPRPIPRIQQQDILSLSPRVPKGCASLTWLEEVVAEKEG